MILYIVRHGETPWNRARRLQGQTDIPLNENGLFLAAETGKALSSVPFDLCFSSPLRRAMQTAAAILSRNEGYPERAAAFLNEHPAYRTQVATLSDAQMLPPDDTAFTNSAAAASSVSPPPLTDISTATGQTDVPAHSSADAVLAAVPLSAVPVPQSSNAMPACLSPYESCPILPDHRIIEINFGRWEGLGCGEHNLEIPPEEFSLFFTTPEQLRMPEGAENVTDVIARTGSFLSDLSGRKELSDKTILVTLHGCAMRALLHPLYPEGSGFWQERCPPQL